MNASLRGIKLKVVYVNLDRPLYKILSWRDEIRKVLDLRGMRQVTQSLYLVFADPEGAGPGTLRLAEIIKDEVKNACLAARHEQGATPR